MELWIRSQDKTMLCKPQYIELQGADEIAMGDINIGYRCVAKYKTKERALEVLDEIQKVVMPKYIISNFPSDKVKDLNQTFKYNYDYIQSDGNINIRELGNYIYEMPKE